MQSLFCIFKMDNKTALIKNGHGRRVFIGFVSFYDQLDWTFTDGHFSFLGVHQNGKNYTTTCCGCSFSGIVFMRFTIATLFDNVVRPCPTTSLRDQ